jgi:hypothetical protein
MKRVSQKGTLFLLPMMFISFAPPKEMNQRKGGRKRQPHPVCPPATLSLNGATKQGAVRTFSGLPMRSSKVKLLITNEKKGEAVQAIIRD